MPASFPRPRPVLLFRAWLAVVLCLAWSSAGWTAEPQVVRGHVPAATARLAPVGFLDRAKHLRLAIGLPPRNQDGLNQLLKDLYDPASPSFRKYLTPAQFTERFGPAAADYEAVSAFAKAHHLTVTATHPNRVVLDVEGAVADIETTFHVRLRTYQHPTEARQFYAPDAEPSLDLATPVLHISGLDNYSLPHPNLMRKPAGLGGRAVANAGSGPGGTYAAGDFRAAYFPGTTLTGAGQSVGLLQFDGYYPSDIAAYTAQFGLTNIPQVVVPIDGGVSTPGDGDVEVSLDIEMVTSMAPGLSTIYVYEAPNESPWDDLLSRMANDNLAQQLSCSWGGGSPDATSEVIFRQMAVQGQSFFNASGDSDAFTGAVSFPADSPSITQVGGTTLTTSGPGGSYVSETVWNWGYDSNANPPAYVGSSGGISTFYSIPAWQQGINMTANQGSTTMRNVPDVAFTADNVYVAFGNGTSETVGGTSCAAPLWAGFTALVNQGAAANSLPSVGFLNPIIYTLGQYCNDITTGNNFSSSSPSLFSAVPGYDLCTGLGTPGAGLISALSSALLATGAAPSNLIYSVNPAVYTIETAIFTSTPSNLGGTIASYAVTPALPAGLALSPTTGVITGTPTAVAPTANYTVTATNAGGSTTAVLSITVNDLPPTELTYSSNTATYTKGKAIATNRPSNRGGAVVSYSVSPALPAGLSLSTTTGLITGTPTVVAAAANYTVTATNSGGSTTDTLKITVNDVAPSGLTYATNPATYTKGTAISANDPSSSGGAVVSYSVSPALPTGLSLSTSTGIVTGTPTAIAAARSYTVKATNTGGSTTVALNITVNDVAPSALAYAANPAVYTKGLAITANAPSNSGGAVVSYSVSPALPAGLSLSTSTGIVTGTPTAITATAAYTVTATNTGGSTTASLTITVNDAAPSSLAYSANPAVYTNGVAITSNTPSNKGGAVVSYAVSPPLPAGLSLNPGTGVITGTPTAITATAAYTVTATNTGGSTMASVSITVNDVAPSALAYSTNPGTYTKGAAIPADSPSSSGGPVVSYSVSPALPAGLSLNTTSGVITGTPMAIAATTAYTVTATNTGGSTTASLSITVNDVAPTSLAYSMNPATYANGVAITNNTPSSSGGPVVGYSVSPALPAGLSLNTGTGIIAGTPTAIAATAAYTVTATNTGGSTMVSLTITVNATAPSSLAYSTNPAIYTKGTAIPANNPSSGGSPVVSYAISPPLPAGLSLSTSTGVLTGTPTAVAATTAYTVTATNTGGSTTASLTITVNDVAPTSLAYSTNPAIYANGVAITNNTPSNSGGSVVGYAVSPPLPAGLALDPNTGIVSGTPTALAPPGNYTITASDTGGSATVALNITIVPPDVLGAPSLLEGPAAGSDSVVLAVTPATGAWTAAANAPWLHLNGNSAAGAGSGNIVLSFDANSGATRTGTCTIGGQTLNVTQAGSAYVAAGLLTALDSSGLNSPGSVAVDGSGNVYIADTGDSVITEWIAATQAVNVLVPTGLNHPGGLAVDGAGNVYIADTLNNAVKKWTAATKTLSTLVSTGLNQPAAVAVDGFGNVYIADTLNDAVKEWTAANQTVSTLISAGLGSVGGVAVDAAGNVYLADTGNSLIKEWLAAAQTVNTLVPSGLSAPTGVAVDGSGNVYIADSGNNAIKEWSASAQTVSTLVATGEANPNGVAVDGSGNIYIADSGKSAIEELPRAFVDPIAKAETAAAGSDALPAVLPATENLRPPFAPASDQSWLSIGTISGGVISFSFTANTAGARTAHLTVLGQQTAVTQGPPAPSGLAYSANPASYLIGVPITNNLPSSAGGPVVSYAVAPALPAGLMLDPVAGVISGTPTALAAPANYTVTATNTGGSTTVALNIAVVSPLEVWRQQFFGTTSNTGNAADDADPYGTGVANLLAFAFFGPNQDPSKVTISQLPQVQVADGMLTYSFTQPAGVSGVTYGAEWSTALASGDWVPIADTGTGNAHLFTVPIGSNPQMFIRLSVTGQ